MPPRHVSNCRALKMWRCGTTVLGGTLCVMPRIQVGEHKSKRFWRECDARGFVGFDNPTARPTEQARITTRGTNA